MAVPNTPSLSTFSYLTSAMAATSDALHKSGAFIDVISKATPTLDRLKDKGKISFQGGRQLAINLMYGLDTPVNSYSDLDPLTITRPDGMSEYFAKWAQYHFPVVISGHEAAVNKGKAELDNLLKLRFRQGMNSAKERLSKDMWDLMGTTTTAAGDTAISASGNGGKNIISLPMIIGPYAAGNSVGGMDTNDSHIYDLYGISPASVTWWRNQIVNHAGSQVRATLLSNLRKLSLECAKQNQGDPDLMIADYTTYANYMEALDTKMQYTSWDKADIGFKGVECMGSIMYPERHVPDMDNAYNWDSASFTDGSVFALNTEHLGFAILSGRDFAPETPQRLIDQDGVVVNHFFEGQLFTDHKGCQGLMHDIPSSFTS